MTKMVDLAGRAVDVPDADAQHAYESRQFGFIKGSRVPIVTEDGQVGSVDAAEAHQAFADGSHLASPEQFHQAELQAQHGGLGGQAAAFGEGIARGATFGLSDPLAIGVADAFGHGAETREHLAGVKEANPISAFGGEAVGTVAPLFIPGAGEAAAARTGASLAEAGRVAGAIPRAVSALGHGAEQLATGLVGANSDILAHRIAQTVIRKAAGAAVEGAAFGAGADISEAALGDHDLSAESLMASMGHTALVGGILGGALGGAGKVAGEVGSAALRKLAPKLSDAAAEQAWKALSPLKKFTEEAEARAGGTAAVGRTLLEEGVIPKEEGLIASALTPVELAPRITAAKERVGEEIGALFERTQGVVTMKEVLDPIDAIIARESKKAGHEGIVSAVQKYRDSLAEKLGLSRSAGYSAGIDGAVESRIPGGAAANDAAADTTAAMKGGGESPGATAYKPGGMPENDNAVLPTRAVNVPGGAAANDNVAGAERLRAGVRSHIPGGLPANNNAFDSFQQVHVPGGAAANENAFAHLPGGGIANDTVPDIIGKHKVHVPGGLAANENARAIPVQDLVAQRRALDELVYHDVKSLDPQQRVAILREIRGLVQDAEISSVEAASKATGGPTGDELRALNRKYQHLRIAEDAAERSSAGMVTNRNISASSYGAAIAAAASGHVMAAPVVAIGHQIIKERGNAMAAVALDRLSQLGMIQRANAQVDKEITGAISGYFRKAPADPRVALLETKPSVRLRTFGQDPKEPASPRTRYEARVEEVAKYASKPGLHAEQVSDHLGGMGSHAPMTVASVSMVANRGTAFLQSKIPEGHTNLTTLTPQLERPRVSDAEMAKFLRYADAVDDPLKIVEDLQKGRVTKESVEAVKTVYPKLYGTIRARVAEELTDRKEKLPYEQRVRIGMLLELPADKSMTAPFQQALKTSYASPAPNPAKPPAASGKKLKFAESMKSESQKIEGGHE